MSYGLTRASGFDDVAKAIVQATKARGYSRAETVACLSTGIQESGLRPTAVHPNGQWVGIYQQDASYPGRHDPNLNIAAFLDRLDVKRRSPGASGDPFKTIFWLQQRPSDPSADLAYARGRKAYYDEIRRHISQSEQLYDRFTGLSLPPKPDQSQEPPVPGNRPDFNEFPIWSPNNSSRGNTKVDAFFLHTQEGGGGDAAAESLANWMSHRSSGVSYHYTISQASDGGVTVVDVVDTDRAAWSVLSANPRSINLCFAGSRAAWTREQWMRQAKAIDVAAYLAVQDCKKYGFATNVIAPPYTGRLPGISDHRYVTKVLGDGTHWDVGDGFPWDVFTAAVTKYATGKPAQPEPPKVKRIPQDFTDRELLIEIWDQLRGPNGKGWPQLGGKSLVDAVAELLKDKP